MKSDRIALREVRLSPANGGINNRADYFWDIPEEFRAYLRHPTDTLYLEMPAEIDLNSVPRGILNVPFVASVLVAAMFLNMEVEVDELDRVYFDSLREIRECYRKMFPSLELNIRVIAHSLTDTQWEADNTGLFFSGGLDATSALIDKLNEKPVLLNIWGADIETRDSASRENLEQYLQEIGNTYGLRYAFVATNARELYKERKLLDPMIAERTAPRHSHGFWADIAHIAVMTAAVAPYACANGIRRLFVGSTYPASGDGFDANNESMVSAQRVGSLRARTVDSEFSRIQKAERIVGFCGENDAEFEIRVCWYRTAGVNCSHCEKCYRTILEIILAGGDPNKLGFRVDDTVYADMRAFVSAAALNGGFWKAIVDGFRKAADRWRDDPRLSWILNGEFTFF